MREKSLPRLARRLPALAGVLIGMGRQTRFDVFRKWVG